MNAIFKREFKAYFTSMIGYVFIGAFLIIANIFFALFNILNSSSSISGVFSSMTMVVMFTVPILTMRSFSEDLKQKTDQLLLTAPVKLRDIVLGKFLAIIGVFIFTLVLTLFWVLIILAYGTPNPGELVGNYIAMICLAGVYIAIGMFISSLTENQFIAAVGSYGIFFLLYILDWVASGMGSSLPVWLSKVAAFVSILGRFGTITSGLFSLSDLLFFISTIALFLFFSYRVLDKKRWS